MFKAGVDIININRIEEKFEKLGFKFFEKILGESELEKVKSFTQKKQVNYVAKRFAAKEAFSKAYGEGIGKTFSFSDIEVLNYENEQPYIQLNDKFKTLKIKSSISLSDDPPYAIAFVIIYQ